MPKVLVIPCYFGLGGDTHAEKTGSSERSLGAGTCDLKAAPLRIRPSYIPLCVPTDMYALRRLPTVEAR